MNRNREFFASVALCGGLALSLTACGDSSEENTSTACAAYDAFVLSVSDARESLNPSSTIGEITAARDRVKDAYADLDDALTNVSEDRENALEDAWSSFDDAAGDIDEEMTVPEAAGTLSDDVSRIETAHSALGEELVCE